MLNFYKDLKEFSKINRKNYPYTTVKYKEGKIKNLIKIPKGVKYIELDLKEIILELLKDV